jgi:SAM-dependent methyltransferase
VFQEFIGRDREVKALDASGQLGTTGRFWINRNLPAFAKRYFPAQGLRVLDIGCGDGPYYRMLEAAGLSGDYLGIDIKPSEFWSQAAPNSSLRPSFLTWDAHRVAELDRTFNAVVSVTAFEHFHEDDAVASGLSRVMEPGAHALVIVPSPYGNFVWGFSHGERKYTPARFARLLAGTDLSLIEAVPAGAAPSLLVNGLWYGVSSAFARAIRFGMYAAYAGNREAARSAHPWVRDLVAGLQYGHLRYGLGRELHRRVNASLYAADERVRICPTQWMFVLRRRP